jgi:3alpha(or 20beta)-hydroxysteroid dehydrogenase
MEAWMGRLTGKVAIVTGAARGQGAAIARRFVEEGATVLITDVLAPEGEALAGELGPRAGFRTLDVSDEAGWADVVQSLLAAHGRIDILVNNAGLFQPKSIRETSAEDFDRHYRVNMLGVFLGMKAVIEPMIAGGGGSIVNTGSNASLRAIPNMFAYGASKWGVRGISKNAAIDLAPHGVRVNCVLPGVIDTPMYHANGPEKMKQYDAMLPLGRRGKPEEIAALVTYLVSEEASYFAGAELTMDGAVFA